METVTYSSAAQIIMAVIPIVGIVIGGQVVFFYLLWRHKQVTQLIKTGLYNPREFNVAVFALLTGILLSCIGLILTIFFLFLEGFSYVLLGGLIPAALGIGLLVFYSISRKKNTER